MERSLDLQQRAANAQSAYVAAVKEKELVNLLQEWPKAMRGERLSVSISHNTVSIEVDKTIYRIDKPSLAAALKTCIKTALDEE